MPSRMFIESDKKIHIKKETDIKEKILLTPMKIIKD